MPDVPAPTSWRERIEGLAGRRRDAATISVVVAVVVFGGLGVWSRGAPPAIAPPARAEDAHPTPSPSGSIVVHVAGAVRKPGVFELPLGSRVADALARAGGALGRADLDGLNLAALLVDGQQVLVHVRGGSVGAAPAVSAAPIGSAPGGLIDLNLADQAMLETISGIGPVTAAAILQHRGEIGSFTSIDQLLDVDGIGPATLESIRVYITL